MTEAEPPFCYAPQTSGAVFAGKHPPSTPQYGQCLHPLPQHAPRDLRKSAVKTA